MNTLRDSAKETIERRMRYLEEAYEAKKYLDLLPQSILDLEALSIEADTNSKGTLNINIYVDPEKAQGLIKVLKMEGFLFASPELMWNHKNLSVTCRAQLTEEVIAHVRIANIPKGQACQIEEVREIKEVLTYKLICPEADILEMIPPVKEAVA